MNKAEKVLREQLNNLKETATLADKQLKSAEALLNGYIAQMPKDQRAMIQDPLNDLKKARKHGDHDSAMNIHQKIVDLQKKYQSDASKYNK